MIVLLLRMIHCRLQFLALLDFSVYRWLLVYRLELLVLSIVVRLLLRVRVVNLHLFEGFGDFCDRRLDNRLWFRLQLSVLFFIRDRDVGINPRDILLDNGLLFRLYLLHR